jgi:nucleotide-binding universal stress UspA family protein
VDTILCPTRGGEGSFPNQDKAIQLSKDKKARLIFLYISDIKFLDRLASPVLVDVEAELEQMGEFVLTMAEIRAEKMGVKAEKVCRSGNFVEVLLSAVKEFEATSIVLGSPAGETAIITQDFLQRLIKDVIRETGIEVYVVHEGEIIEHFTPTSTPPDEAGNSGGASHR